MNLKLNIYKNNKVFPVDVESKGASLSEVERLGKWSMLAKVSWEVGTKLEKRDRPTSDMILLVNSCWVNTTPITNGTLCNRLSIIAKSQLVIMSTLRSLLRQAGQDFESKSEILGMYKNSGSPKRSKSFSKRDGVSVILKNFIYKKSFRKYLKEGKQLMLDLHNVSGRATYSTRVCKSGNSKLNKKIECKYRELFQVDIYKTAYDKLKSKPGNMTAGVDKETLDGISLGWAEKVCQQMKDRTFKFKPSSRVYIPKAKGLMRPLGIPSPRDKIIQQAMRILFESVYEPIFLNSSHGFRPNRSTTTAIFEVRKWNGITWMIEGDIKGFFDNIDHHILANLLKDKIDDKNLIDLYWKLVKVGYVNNGNYYASSLGVPQGGIISPLLSNIYLHEFDLFMKNLCEKYTDKSKRVSKPNPMYTKLRSNIKKLEKIKILNKEQLQDLKAKKKELVLTSAVIRTSDTGTRVYFNRYADDWIVGVSGNLKLAKAIKEEIHQFLRDKLKLTLNIEKTKITHMIEDKAKYLGFYIFRKSRLYTESLRSKMKSTGTTRRATNASVIIEAPIDLIIKKLIDQKYAKMTKGKKVRPAAITKWIYLTSEELVLRYNAIIGGICNYYSFVENKNQLSYVLWILKFSLIYTLARKLRLSVRKIFRKFGKKITIEYKVKEESKTIRLLYPSLARNRVIKIPKDYSTTDPFKVKFFSVRSGHVWNKPCQICGNKGDVEMHHVRHIKKGKATGFTKIMSNLNRKQIAVCRGCHLKIHSGTYDSISLIKLE